MPAPRPDRIRPYLAVSLVWLVWGLLYTAYLQTFKPGVALGRVAQYAFSDAILWLLLTPAVAWVGWRLPLRLEPLRIASHLLIGLCFGMLETTLDAVQNQILVGGDLSEFLRWALPGRLHVNLMIYGAILGFSQLTLSQRRETALRADLAEAQLQTLRLQLQPHFLFNSLNAISGLTESRPAQARSMVERLATLLRLALRTHQEDRVPLHTELEFTRCYLDIERVRYGERLRVDIQVDEEAESAMVPSFLLQPLAENAVRHGIAPLTGGGRLTIRAERQGSRLRLDVLDDGVGIEGGAGRQQGIGLGALRTRLQDAYGAEGTLRVGPRRPRGTRVHITLPFVPSEVPIDELSCAR